MARTEPRTLTLQEVLDGADRAASRVAKWPAWKRELSMPKKTPEQRVAVLEEDLEKAREHIRKLKEEVTTQREALERRNREADALGRVWCDGGCGGGMDRFRKDYREPPDVTAEQVAFLLRNARRAYSWYVNRASKAHGLRERIDMSELKKRWQARREDVALALVEQHEAEVQKLMELDESRR